MISVALSLLLGACGTDASDVGSTTSAPPKTTTSSGLPATTSSSSTTTSTSTTAPAPPPGPALELAELLEPLAGGCAESIANGEADVSQYPAADLTQPNAVRFYGIEDVASCFGLFPGIFILVFDSPDSRLYTTVASAWLGCSLSWTDGVRYVAGSEWAIDAPYWEEFPGEEVAQLTDGKFTTRSCEDFMDAYAQEIGEDFVMDLRPSVSLKTLLFILGEE